MYDVDYGGFEKGFWGGSRVEESRLHPEYITTVPTCPAADPLWNNYYIWTENSDWGNGYLVWCDSGFAHQDVLRRHYGWGWGLEWDEWNSAGWNWHGWWPGD